MGIGGNGSGGGVITSSPGVQLLNDTIAFNMAVYGAGFIAGEAYGGGVADDGGTGMLLVNDTITQNAALGFSTSPVVGGGGLINVAGIDTTMTVRNTIIAANTANVATNLTPIGGVPSPGDGPDVAGVAFSTDNNLIGIYDGAASGFSTLNGDQLGTTGSPIAPGLAPALANNGGIVQTLALLAGSPALGKGDVAAATASNLSTDERGPGFARTVNGMVDVGAFEFQNNTSATTLVSSMNPATINQNVTFTATVSPTSGVNVLPTGQVQFYDDGNPLRLRSVWPW